MAAFEAVGAVAQGPFVITASTQQKIIHISNQIVNKIATELFWILVNQADEQKILKELKEYHKSVVLQIVSQLNEQMKTIYDRMILEIEKVISITHTPVVNNLRRCDLICKQSLDFPLIKSIVVFSIHVSKKIGHEMDKNEEKQQKLASLNPQPVDQLNAQEIKINSISLKPANSNK